MNEKPPLAPRNYRPAFFVEKENAEIALDIGMRTCIGYPTLPDKTSAIPSAAKSFPKDCASTVLANVW